MHHRRLVRWLRSPHIEGERFDLVLRDIADLHEVSFGSPVKTSDHSAVFKYVVLEQLSPHSVCRQEVYLKNSYGWNWLEGM